MNLKKSLLFPPKIEARNINKRHKFYDPTDPTLILSVTLLTTLFFFFDSVMCWSHKLGIKILSFPYQRHAFNEFCSHSSCKFTCLQQTWLLQFTVIWQNLNKLWSFKSSLAHVFTNPLRNKLHWLPIQSILLITNSYLLTLIIFNLQQLTTRITNKSSTFPSHSVYIILIPFHVSVLFLEMVFLTSCVLLLFSQF